MANSKSRIIPVATEEELRARTLEYVQRGFKITSQSQDLVQLEYKRSGAVLSGGEIVIMLLLLILCVLPGLIYFFVKANANMKPEYVTLRLDPEAVAATGTARAAGNADAQGSITRTAEAPSGKPLPPPLAGTGEGWLPDPSGRHPDRWWNGSEWTTWVRDKPGGTRSEDPPVASPAPMPTTDTSSATTAADDGEATRGDH